MSEALWQLEAGPDVVPRAQTDELAASRLVARLRAGDAGAFEQLYRLQVDRIFGLAFRLTGDRGEAEELTQEVFVRAWQSRASFQNADHFSRWLRKVAVHEWINAVRRKGNDRVDGRVELEVAVERTPAAGTAPPGLRIDLERALARLTPRLRAVLLLFDAYGLRHEEIAELLEITPGASKVQLHRARTRLREVLQ